MRGGVAIRGRIALAVSAVFVLASPVFGQHYAEENGWQFSNVKDASLAWDIYRDTFIGIPPDRDPFSSAFDVLFFDQVYETQLAKDGNCYGMSLLSVMMLAKGGHLGHCLPVSQYSGAVTGDTNASDEGPDDTTLKRAINIMHGHQVNVPTLQLLLDVFAQGKSRDGAFAYQAWQQARMQNDLALVSITKTLNPADGGHTMVAYDAQDMGDGTQRIYVYDPNRTWAADNQNQRGWYSSGQNYIQIAGSAWSFAKSPDTTWSGDPASGGNIVITPASVTGPHARSPASLGDQIIGQVLNELILTGSSAQIQQVTDARGKRLYKPGTLEMDNDPVTGMMAIVPWYASDQTAGGPTPTVLFGLAASVTPLSVDVAADDPGYSLTMAGARSHVTVKALRGRGMERITLQNPGTIEPRVVLENRRGTEEYEVQVVLAVRPRARLHVIRLTHVGVPTGARVEVSVLDRGRALRIESPVSSTQYDLEYLTVTKKGTESLERSRLIQEEASARTVRPKDWSDLRNSGVLEEQSTRKAHEAATLR
jgi:hypothetical protein